MPEMTEDALARISEHPWEETIPRLVRHALQKMRRHFWQGIFGGPTPGGKEAQDLVMGSITKVVEGERFWDPEDQPDLFFFLKSVVDSEISHLVEGFENRRVFREAALSNKGGEEGEMPGFWETVSCPNPGPEAVLLHKERERLSERFFWGFYEHLSDSPILQKMLECILEGCVKRAEIAEGMGIPVKEFDNLKKQVQRRLKSFQEQGSGGWE